MARTLVIFAAVGLMVLLLSTPGVAGDVKLSIVDGRVTLIANNVTVRQILEEWARVGQSRVVNVDKLQGAPVTLELTDVPERQALDVILRSVPGYMAALRTTPRPGASVYDPILLLVTRSSVPAAASGAAAAVPAGRGRARPAFQTAPAAPDDGPVEADFPPQDPSDFGPEGPPNGPPDPNVDYANPRQMMRQRLMQQQVEQPEEVSGPPPEASFPGAVGGTDPQVQSAPRPGMVVNPPNEQQTTPPIPNPYGLPGVPGGPPRRIPRTEPPTELSSR